MTDPEKKMPLVGHLGELRNRLIICALAVGVGFVGAFFFSDQLLRATTRPLAAELIFISPAEAFWANLKISLFAGILLSLPVVLYQIWAFIAPGLFHREKKYGLIFVLSSIVFFALGGAFCGFVVLPFALKFLINFGGTAGIKPTISIGLYIDFVVKFFLAFGLIFQLPLIITLLSKLGVLTPAFLSAHRRYAILLAFVAAAILTPTPDIFNQLLMAGPIILLYELGILAAKLFAGKKRKAGLAEQDIRQEM